MAAITDNLLKELKNTSDIEAFFKTHEMDFLHKTTAEYLTEIQGVKGISTSSVAEDSGVGEYTYKIFKGTKKPSRDILIAIAFGMKLSLEETQFVLRISKFAVLDSRDKRDAIIIYGITHEMTVFQTDDMLDENNLVTIN
ncbi:MAG: helix-turn-helix transcriptional regulator [Clostridia bacterium]|nr:helix-turn-helix transcriptional regulator [Clostridia bacterium]